MTKVVVPSNLSTEFVLDATAKKIKLTPDVYDRTKQTGTQPFTTISGKAVIGQLPTGTTADTVALGNHSHGIATTTVNGFMSSTDKAKLDSLVNSEIISVDAPVIDVTEPTDAEQVQGEIQKLVNALVQAKVFKNV